MAKSAGSNPVECEWYGYDTNCRVCGLEYTAYRSHDPGCPNLCPNQEGKTCDFCDQTYFGLECGCEEKAEWEREELREGASRFEAGLL